MPRLFRRAKRLLQHPEDLLAMLGEGMKKAYAKRKALFHVFEEFLVLIRLVKAWVTGEYRETPRKVILWAVLAILYFLSPIDALPDILPGGYIDDIALISFIISKIRVDLEKFLVWEKSKTSRNR